VERRGHPLSCGPRGRAAGASRRARVPPPGGPRGARHLRRRARVQRVCAQRARAGLRALPLQARLAGRPARRRRPGPAGGDGVRGHEHRAGRHRRVRPRRLRRPHPRDGARAGRPGQPHGAGAARRRARSLAAGARVHLLGLPRRDVPPGPRHAHRPGPGRCAGGGQGAGGVGRSAGAQGHRPERPRAGDRRPRRGARRGHRPGRAAALGPGHRAPGGQAAAVAAVAEGLGTAPTDPARRSS
jgi:hypothetical protein